jgi:hypothetical protein
VPEASIPRFGADAQRSWSSRCERQLACPVATGQVQCFVAAGCRCLELRLTESGLNAFRLNTRSSTFTAHSAEWADCKSACSPRVPLGAGTLDLFETLPIPVGCGMR